MLKTKGPIEMSKFSHLIDLDTYSVSEWNKIIALAEKIKKIPLNIPKGVKAE